MTHLIVAIEIPDLTKEQFDARMGEFWDDERAGNVKVAEHYLETLRVPSNYGFFSLRLVGVADAQGRIRDEATPIERQLRRELASTEARLEKAETLVKTIFGLNNPEVKHDSKTIFGRFGAWLRHWRALRRHRAQPAQSR